MYFIVSVLCVWTLLPFFFFIIYMKRYVLQVAAPNNINIYIRGFFLQIQLAFIARTFPLEIWTSYYITVKVVPSCLDLMNSNTNSSVLPVTITVFPADIWNVTSLCIWDRNHINVLIVIIWFVRRGSCTLISKRNMARRNSLPFYFSWFYLV